MTYKGKKFSVLGDSISTLEGCNPPDYAVFYQGEMKYRSGVYAIDDTWWGIVIKILGGELLKNDSWSGSLVCKHPMAEVPSYACSEKRTSSLGSGDIFPDVVMIFMGINDLGMNVKISPSCDAERSDLSIFTVAYKTVLSEIKRNYPHAEIMCITLPKVSAREQIPYYMNFSGDRLADYSAAIKKCAEDEGCTVIDLNNSPLKYSSIDGCHPTKQGMQEIAEEILKILRGDL